MSRRSNLSDSVRPTPRWIRDLRLRAGLNREWFAIEVGVSYESVCKWEQGARQPDRRATLLLLKFEQRLERKEKSVREPMLTQR